MKKLILFGLLLLTWATAQAQYADERTGYEGDFFSLQGALDLFKQSTTLRDFERKLNTEEYWVNNLDLNYDGRIDYIRVEHRRQGNFHAIILQAIVDNYEVQDVAVIEIEVTGRGRALLQIVGDEYLYGEEVVVEPVAGYADSRSGYQTDYVNVFYWPSVQYILGNRYRQVYRSPYRWQYYPTWWAPRVPLTWGVFRPRVVVYYRWYQVAPRLRVVRVHNFYRPYRAYSSVVVVRTNRVRVQRGRPPLSYAATNRGRNQNAGTPPAYNQPRNSARTATGRTEPTTRAPRTARSNPATSPRTTSPRTTAPRTTAPRTTAPRSSGKSTTATPRTQQPTRAPRTSRSNPATTPRTTRPRTTAPRTTAPTRSGKSPVATPRTQQPTRVPQTSRSTPRATSRSGGGQRPATIQRSTPPRVDRSGATRSSQSRASSRSRTTKEPARTSRTRQSAGRKSVPAESGSRSRTGSRGGGG